jgi:hypothetical protein
MYARNAASPEPIAIGAVVQISDGAVQTSGCTVRIKPIGVAEGDGGGTTAYSTDGIVLYTPTQAETNYTSFILIAKKTGCIPACVTVVTTASSVPGRTVPADGSITAAVIATDAIDADAIKADAVTEIQSGLATATNVSDAQTAIITQVDANETKIDAVKAKTDNLPSDPADQSAVEAAITAATSPLATAANLATVQADTDDIQTRLPAALESGRIAAALDSASIDAIWNEVLTGATHNIASSAGRRLRQLADTVVLVDGVCDAASNAGTDSTGTITLEVGTTTACVGQAIRCENQVRFIASYNAGTRVAQLDRPWCVVPDAGDEYVIFNVRNPLVGLASLALAGSTAAVVNDVLVDTGTTLPAQINVIDDLLDTEMPALTAAVAAEAVKTTAIQAKTDNLPSDPADQSLVEAAITAATSGLATPAQVNAEVLDVLSVDTFAELAAPPAASSSLKDKITWLFMYARNKVTQTAIARTLYRDDTTTIAGTSATSDNGTTFTKGEDA